MNSVSAHQTIVRRWLERKHGDQRCPKCGAENWQVSNPDYPIIECLCRACGHAVITDTLALESVDDHVHEEA